MIWDNPIAAMRMRDRAAVKLLPIETPQPCVLVSSRDDQAQFSRMAPPGNAQKLVQLAEAAGWGVTVLWSLVAVPAGYKQSTRHKVTTEARLELYCGVRLRAHGIRAYGLWAIPGGFRSGGLRTRTEARPIGAEELIKYVGG